MYSERRNLLAALAQISNETHKYQNQISEPPMSHYMCSIFLLVCFLYNLFETHIENEITKKHKSNVFFASV